MQLIMFVPFHFLAYIPFNVLLPGESNPGHTAYAVGIPQSSFVIMRAIIHTRPYLLLPVLSPPRSVANLKAPSSTLLGVTTPHHSFPPPALSAASAVWEPRTTSFFRNPTKPKFPAALFSQPLRPNPSNLLNASVAISTFHATSPDTPRSA